jgi:hypothetical protein
MPAFSTIGEELLVKDGQLDLRARLTHLQQRKIVEHVPCNGVLHACFRRGFCFRRVAGMNSTRIVGCSWLHGPPHSEHIKPKPAVPW